MLQQEEFWQLTEWVTDTSNMDAASLRNSLNRDFPGWDDDAGKQLYEYFYGLFPATVQEQYEVMAAQGDISSKIAYLERMVEDFERPESSFNEDGTKYWGGIGFGWIPMPNQAASETGEGVQEYPAPEQAVPAVLVKEEADAIYYDVINDTDINALSDEMRAKLYEKIYASVQKEEQKKAQG